MRGGGGGGAFGPGGTFCPGLHKRGAFSRGGGHFVRGGGI